jgi:hypothetical protein
MEIFMERLIALPDENLIKEFSKKYAEENSVPAQLYVDCHIELSSYMMKNARDRGFEDLDTGPFTPELAVQSGFRLFTSVICCHDRFNGETAFRHFQANLDNTIRILEKMIHVNSSSDIETLKKETDKLGSIFLLDRKSVV